MSKINEEKFNNFLEKFNFGIFPSLIMGEDEDEIKALRKLVEEKRKNTEFRNNRKHLRELLYTYSERYERLTKNRQEAKDTNDREAIDVNNALMGQCRIMIAELWHTMVIIGALDDEEIEFGSIKNRE